MTLNSAVFVFCFHLEEYTPTFLQSRNRDLWSEVVSAQHSKGQLEHAERLRRSTSVSGNGRWLFGHFIQDGTRFPVQGREIRRQQPYAGGAESPSGGSGYSGQSQGAGPSQAAPAAGGAGPSGGAGSEECERNWWC